MQHTIKGITHRESFLPTPRHRKLRYREVKHDFTATFADVSASEAPVAIIQHGTYCLPLNQQTGERDVWHFGYPRNLGERQGGCKYRWYNDQLWLRPRLSHRLSLHGRQDRLATWADVMRHFVSHSFWNRDHDEVQQIIDERAAHYINVDGLPYISVGEPRYVVMTFGLGGNHASTALMEDNSYNPNIAASRYFRIDQMEEALESTKEVALGRGDTDSVPVEPPCIFDIEIPEAVRIQPAAEHGDGDPFINQIESIAQCKEPVVTGLTAMALAFQQ